MPCTLFYRAVCVIFINYGKHIARFFEFRNLWIIQNFTLQYFEQINGAYNFIESKAEQLVVWQWIISTRTDKFKIFRAWCDLNTPFNIHADVDMYVLVVGLNGNIGKALRNYNDWKLQSILKCFCFANNVQI